MQAQIHPFSSSFSIAFLNFPRPRQKNGTVAPTKIALIMNLRVSADNVLVLLGMVQNLVKQRQKLGEISCQGRPPPRFWVGSGRNPKSFQRRVQMQGVTSHECLLLGLVLTRFVLFSAICLWEYQMMLMIIGGTTNCRQTRK